MNEGKMGARSLPEAEIAPTFGARTVVDRPIHFLCVSDV